MMRFGSSLIACALAVTGCGESSGTGGAGSVSFGGRPPEGGALIGGFPPATCYVDAQCGAGDEATCACQGCNPDGCYAPDASPPIESDCTCPVCAGHESCSPCDENGVCDPFLETCTCIDCAPFPACQA